MAKQFTFEGTVQVKKEFSVTITAHNYQEALEAAQAYMEDEDRAHAYLSTQGDVEVEIDSFEEVPEYAF